MRCRHRLSKLLLRHGRVWDRSAWTKVHREWLSAQTFEQVNTELAFIDNLAACDGLRPARTRSTSGSHRSCPTRVLAAGPPLARIPRDRHALGADHRARGLRLRPLLARGAARIVAGAGALPRAVRRVRSPWVDHQDQLEVRPADPRRGGLALRPPPRIGRTLYERQEGLPDHVLQIAHAPRAASTNPPADAGAQQAGQRDHRRVRARARLLSLGRRHCAIAHTDSPSPLGWGGAGPRSPLVRAMVLWAALTRPRPILDTRHQHATRDLG